MGSYNTSTNASGWFGIGYYPQDRGVCPGCGRCDQCGRGGGYYPNYPQWTYPVTSTTGHVRTVEELVDFLKSSSDSSGKPKT